MMKENRRVARDEASFEITLELRAENDDTVLVESIPGILKNITPKGAGVQVSRVFFDKYHLFYSPLAGTEFVLFLQAKITDKVVVSIPVKPCWFNSNEGNVEMPFCMGVEFIPAPGDERITALNRRVRAGRPGLTQEFWTGLLKNFLTEKLSWRLIASFQH